MNLWTMSSGSSTSYEKLGMGIAIVDIHILALAVCLYVGNTIPCKEPDLYVVESLIQSPCLPHGQRARIDCLGITLHIGVVVHASNILDGLRLDQWYEWSRREDSDSKRVLQLRRHRRG